MKILSEFEAKKFLVKNKIPCIKDVLISEKSELKKIKIKFPAFMKISSPDILHKTDANCVLEIKREDELNSAFDQLLKNAKKYNPNAKIEGVVLEEKLSGVELIVGVSVDPQFGHVIMFGLGGIFVEILKDVNFRAIPLNKKDAFELIEEMHAKGLLEGFRNQKKVNKAKIAEFLLKISKIVEKNPNIRELDINPLFANEKGVIAADALLRFN